jgi:hypothetical protein
MYYQRARGLDLPEDIRQRILFELDSGIVTRTGLNDRETLPPWEELEAKIKANFPQSYLEYYRSIYFDFNLEGFDFSPDLTKDILNHYADFLAMVPDAPKVTIKLSTTYAGRKTFHLHNGEAQSCTFTCIAKGVGAVTSWYDIKPEFDHKFRNPPGSRLLNKKGIAPHPSEVEEVTRIKLREWEMVIFDNNSVHMADGIENGVDRWIISVGFLNISATELEDIYSQWWSKKLNEKN